MHNATNQFEIGVLLTVGFSRMREAEVAAVLATEPGLNEFEAPRWAQLAGYGKCKLASYELQLREPRP